MIRRVLFVDDEPQVLEGLRHRLRRQRRQWDMLFASSGQTALEIMSGNAVDVIVTDMRMPKMDGAALLQRVQELHPGVVRIVLSGHAELETSLRAVPVAHQFLNKPCEAGVIESVVERACRLQQLIDDDAVKATIGRIRQLPPLPRIYSQLMVALADEKSSTSDIAHILKQDIAICAKILQVVNSAFFRLPRSIATIEEAVRYLGLASIKYVALAVEVFQQGQTTLPAGFSMAALQQHSILVGNVASSFFPDKQRKEDAFVVGLLHDIGILLLAFELPKHMTKVLTEMNTSGCPMTLAEEKTCGVTHAEIGGYLLGLWGLPYPVIEAVANHHAPSRVESTEFDILAATYIADTLVRELEEDRFPSDGPSQFDVAYLQRIGVADRLESWRKEARSQFERRQREER